MNRSMRLIAAALLAGVFAASAAQAATEAPYSQAAFATAQQQGKPILIHVKAPWCPVCAKQKPILAKLSADPACAAVLAGMSRLHVQAAAPELNHFEVPNQLNRADAPLSQAVPGMLLARRTSRDAG